MKTLTLIFRRFKKSSTATTLGILGLIAGLVCVLYIFIWVNNEINHNKTHQNIDRIFIVHAFLKGGAKEVTFSGCPPAVGPAMKEEYPEVENTCRYLPAEYFKMLISNGQEKEELETAFSDFSLFDIFTIPFVSGNSGENNTPNRIVISQRVAHIFFGQTNPIGKTLKFNNQLDLTVAGVVQDMPTSSSIQFDAVVPLENLKMFYGRDDFLTTWYNNGFKTYGLLKSSAGFDKVASTITNRIQKEMPESTNYLRAYQFKNEYLYEQKHIRNVKIFSLIGLLVFVAAVLNFINLFTARMSKQAKETGVRKSLGATRAQIIRFIYSDIAIICLMAFVASLIIALVGLSAFATLIGKHIEMASIFTPLSIGSFILIYLITVFLTGIYPAVYLSSFSAGDTLKSGFHSVKNNGIFRNSLVVTIFVVSIILLSSTLIIGRQINYLQKIDIGFNKDQLMYINLNGKLRDKASALKTETNRLAGVYASTLSSQLPVYMGNNGEGWEWEGKDVNFKPLVTNWSADEDLVKTLDAQMVEGSFFEPGQEGVVINKAFADAIGWKSFTGKTINGYGTDYRILGVMKDIRYNSLAEPCRPTVIFKTDIESANYLIVKFDPHQISSLISQITSVCNELEPDYPAKYGFIDQDFNQLLSAENDLNKLVKVFSLFAVLVLCLGLLGVVIFMAEQKTKEIGIRKSMGEELSSLVFRFIKPFIVSGMIASLIAIPVAWIMMKNWLENYTYRIDLSAWMFIASILFVVVIATITVSWQSFKAASRNPVEALRYE